ncbi:MAG: GNAT family N-acetyltransferase [Paludibacter sp.]
MTPFVFGVSENDVLVGVISGYVIADGNIAKRFFSRRAIICGGLLADSRISEEATVELLKITRRKLKNKAIYIEFRNYTDYSAYRKAFEKAGFEYRPHLNFHVATPDVDVALKKLSSTKRRDVKLSYKSGAEWVETTEPQDIRDYYLLLSHLYKTKVKTPLFPFEFFEKLVQLPEGKLFAVKYNGEVIGGSLCVVLPDRTMYEWFVCGLDGKTKNIFPSTLATWSAIEYAASRGIERFDMMGAGKPNNGYGVRDFKAKFGGELVEHGRFLHLNQPNLYKLGKFVIDLYKGNNPGHKAHPTTKCTYKIQTELDEKDFQEWAGFVMKQPQGNIFQSPEMYAVYQSTPRFTPVVLLARNEKNEVAGCLLSVIQRDFNGVLIEDLTARSIVYGGPLAENNNPEIVDALLQQYDRIITTKAIYSQFRNLADTSALKNVFVKNGYNYDEHLDILLDLTKSKQELESNLHKERRRNIAKAEKEGLVFKHLAGTEEILDVIRLLKQTYSRVKVPLPYESLFMNSREKLGENIHFFGAYFSGIMIAGQVRLCYKDSVYAWYAGSDSRYFNKRPNDFLLWNVLLWSKEHDYKLFDFGGAGKPDIPYGVRDYKLKFGGELVSYGRYEKTHKKLLMSFGKTMYSLYRKTKR